MMAPIQVTARFEANGEIKPENFHWQGINYPVVSTGRHWVDDKGYHILVMTPGDQFHELIFVPTEMLWYMSNVGAYRYTV
jgi:hypothetical protein